MTLYLLSAADTTKAVPPGGPPVLVEVDGAKLTIADLEKTSAAALFQARTNYYTAERAAIDSLVDDYLLQKAAGMEGLTVPELLERHVSSGIPKDPSEEALRVYYEGVSTTEPYEAVRPKILDALRERRMAKAKKAYLDSLRSHASVVFRLAPPRAPVSMKDVPVRGDTHAPVKVVEYADFECPYCQQAAPVLNKLEEDFRGKIAFGYKDYPLPMHPDSQKAAEAAHCAGAQGRYWEYHDLLFAKKVLDVQSLKADARELKLDGDAFDRCLDSGQTATIVKEQATEAQALGLQGTPSILVNGRLVTSMTYEGLRDIVNEELAAGGSHAEEAAAYDASQRN